MLREAHGECWQESGKVFSFSCACFGCDTAAVGKQVHGSPHLLLMLLDMGDIGLHTCLMVGFDFCALEKRDGEDGTTLRLIQEI